jgi:glycosyltransferase involved in cell wall biosynthesis
MKILYIDPFCNPDYMGGAQKSLLNIMIDMKKRGHNIILATPGTSMLSQNAEKNGIGVTKFLLPKLINTRISIGKKKFFNIFAAIYDLFIFIITGLSIFKLIKTYKSDIVHSNQMIISISAGLACKMRKVPCIWHIRENPADHISKYILLVFGKLGDSLSDQVLVNSKYTAKIFINTALYKKIKVIPIGINYRINENNISKNKPFNSKPVVTILGRIIPMKGHETLIRSLKFLKQKQLEVDMYIIGHFDENDTYYLYLLSLINEFGLHSNIKFYGFRSNINTMLNSSNIIIAPSTEPETFGRTIIESMAVGKPVIASCIGAHPEIIQDGLTGFLVSPGKSEELAAKIELILTDKELQKKMGELGKQRYDKLYTLDNYCTNIESIYDSFLS